MDPNVDGDTLLTSASGTVSFEQSFYPSPYLQHFPCWSSTASLKKTLYSSTNNEQNCRSDPGVFDSLDLSQRTNV